jgi:hypothetical protein
MLDLVRPARAGGAPPRAREEGAAAAAAAEEDLAAVRERAWRQLFAGRGAAAGAAERRAEQRAIFLAHARPALAAAHSAWGARRVASAAAAAWRRHAARAARDAHAPRAPAFLPACVVSAALLPDPTDGPASQAEGAEVTAALPEALYTPATLLAALNRGFRGGPVGFSEARSVPAAGQGQGLRHLRAERRVAGGRAVVEVRCARRFALRAPLPLARLLGWAPPGGAAPRATPAEEAAAAAFAHKDLAGWPARVLVAQRAGEEWAVCGAGGAEGGAEGGAAEDAAGPWETSAAGAWLHAWVGCAAALAADVREATGLPAGAVRALPPAPAHRHAGAAWAGGAGAQRCVVELRPGPAATPAQASPLRMARLGIPLRMARLGISPWRAQPPRARPARAPPRRVAAGLSAEAHRCARRRTRCSRR